MRNIATREARPRHKVERASVLAEKLPAVVISESAFVHAKLR
jgi:hypothetical protein